MKTLYRYSLDKDYNNQIIDEAINEISSEMICESFKSSLLSNLANKIKKLSKEHNEEVYKRILELDPKYRKHSDAHEDIKSFSSIFGPYTYRNVYVAIKWADITDDDFKLYHGNKEMEDIINNKSKDYLILVCPPNTKDIKYAIQIFRESGWHTNFMYWFTEMDNEKEEKGINWGNMLKSYKETSETLDKRTARAIGKNDAYVLEITNDMKKEYNDVINKRAEDKKGMINYDEKSLEALKRKQQRRYEEIVSKMKAEKIKSNPDSFFDEIKETQDQVTEIYKTIVKNVEHIDKFRFLGLHNASSD